MRPPYLLGERVYLRGMREEDASSAMAWHGSDFPVNSSFGERQLKELHQQIWSSSKLQLAIVETTDDRLIGGAVVRFASRDRKAAIDIHMASRLDDADSLRGETLRILSHWLIHDHNMRRVDAMVAGDADETIRVAGEIGMIEAVRLREYWRTFSGRVDAVIFHMFNPNEEQCNA